MEECSIPKSLFRINLSNRKFTCYHCKQKEISRCIIHITIDYFIILSDLNGKALDFGKSSDNSIVMTK